MLNQFDQTILMTIQSFHTSYLDELSQWVSRGAGSPWFWLGLILLLAATSWKRFRLTFWHLVVAFGLELLVVEIIVKPLVHRSRPFWVLPIRVIDPVTSSYSFPSGHVAAATAGLWVIVHYFPKLRWPAIVFVLLVGLSRIYNGDHWPSDVAGGLVVGSLVGWFTVWLFSFLPQASRLGKESRK